VRKNHSKERTARTAVVKKTQALISEDPGQSLQKLASIVDVSEPTIRRIAEEDLRYKSMVHTSHLVQKPFGPKLALRQYQYVLVQGILAS